MFMKAGVIKGMSTGFETLQSSTDGDVSMLKDLRLLGNVRRDDPHERRVRPPPAPRASVSPTTKCRCTYGLSATRRPFKGTSRPFSVLTTLMTTARVFHSDRTLKWLHRNDQKWLLWQTTD